jgi:hypothetical protein
MSAADDSTREAPVQPSPQDRRGLRNRLNRISHFDVNVGPREVATVVRGDNGAARRRLDRR